MDISKAKELIKEKKYNKYIYLNSLSYPQFSWYFNIYYYFKDNVKKNIKDKIFLDLLSYWISSYNRI
jgi:hypothetical protein